MNGYTMFRRESHDRGIRRSLRAIPATAILLIFVALAAGACGPTGDPQTVLQRRVPDPSRLSGESIEDDSVVAIRWTTRTDIPDPLADPDGGPRMVFQATLYSEDVIVAGLADSCKLDSNITTAALAENECFRRERAAYDQRHQPDRLLRIRIRLRSTFSVNSLHPRFWDLFLRTEDGIMVEPVRVDLGDPVVVRRDTLPPEPGRAPIRAGLYRRSVDLYFPLKTPFGVETLGTDADAIRLVVSRERHELATLVWDIRRTGQTTSSARRRPRASEGPSGF